MRRFAIVWFCAAAVLAAGCSDDPGSPDADLGADATPPDANAADSGGLDAALGDVGTSTLTADGYCAAVHGTVCDGLQRCGCSLEGRRFGPSDCQAVRVAECRASIQPALDAIALGTVSFNAEGADRCVAAIRELAARCAVIDASTLPFDCTRIFSEVSTIGGACARDQAACAGDQGICADGRCLLLPARGEACLDVVLCAAGTICRRETGRCGDPLAFGDPCEGRGCPLGTVCRQDTGSCGPPLGSTEGPCESSSQCAEGLTCGSDRSCIAGAPRGATCGGPSVCASGLACVRSYEQRTCGPRAGAGAPCQLSADCAAGLICEDGRCGAAPGQGADCAKTPDGLRCAPPLVCDTDDTRTCVEAPGRGQMCLIGSSICASGSGCEASSNMCIAPPGEGEPCTVPDNLCAEGFGCDFTEQGSVCAARRGIGGPCQSHQICETGAFCDFTTNTCAPLRTLGQPCPLGEPCAPGLECNDLAGAASCRQTPTSTGAPCLHGCGELLACLGPGGACAPEICASP